VSASCTSGTGWLTFYCRRRALINTEWQPLARAWMRGLRHKSRHKVRAKSHVEPVRSCPISRVSKEFPAPRFKLIVRRVAVSTDSSRCTDCSGFRTHEPVDIPLEEPTLVDEMIATYSSDLGYNISEISAHLHESEDHIQDVFITQETQTQTRKFWLNCKRKLRSGCID
jgi:hypothetical protein